MNLFTHVPNLLKMLAFGSLICLSSCLVAQGIDNPLDPTYLSAGTQPAIRSYGEIMGINLKVYEAPPQTLLLDDIADFLRYFHYMNGGGRDFGPIAEGHPATITSIACPPIISSADCASCPSGTMVNLRDFYCQAKEALPDVEIHTSLVAITENVDADEYPNVRNILGFPHFNYRAEQWGENVSDAFDNARIYGKAFAENYCPKNDNGEENKCLVDLLELGNEPWGVPGLAYYQAIFRGLVLGINDYYNDIDFDPSAFNYSNSFEISPSMVNQSTWRMRISAPAYQFLQNTTLTFENSGENLPTNDQVGVMPTDVWPYLESVNIHPYAFQLIRNEAGTISDFNFVLDQHPESADGMFLSILNAVKWRNDNFPLANLAVTEYGWDSETVGPETQGIYLIRSLLLAGRLGIDEMVMYELNDDPFQADLYKTSGLFTSNNSAKPAFFAIRRFRELVGDLYFLDKLNQDDFESESTDAMFYILGNESNHPTHIVAWLPKSMNGISNPLEEQVTLAGLPPHLNIDQSAPIILLNSYNGIGHNTKSFNDVFPDFAAGNEIEVNLSPIPYLIELEATNYSYPESNENPSVSYSGPLCDLVANTETAMITADGGTSEVIILGTEHPLNVRSSSDHFSVSIEDNVVSVSANQNLSSNEYYAAITVESEFCNPIEIKVFQPSLRRLPCEIEILELRESNTNVTNTSCRFNSKTYTVKLKAEKTLTKGANILLEDLPSGTYLGGVSSSGNISEVNKDGKKSIRWSIPSLLLGQTYQVQVSFCNVPIHQGPIKVTTDPDSPNPCEDYCNLSADIQNLVIPEIGGTGVINISGNNTTLFAYGKNSHFRVNVIGNQIQIVAPLNDDNAGNSEYSPITIYSKGCPSVTVYVNQEAFTQGNCDISFTHFKETNETVSPDCPSEFARTYELKFVSDRDIPIETEIFILNVPGTQPYEDQNNVSHGNLGTRQEQIVNGSTQFFYVWKLPNINKGIEYSAKIHFCWVTSSNDPGRATASLNLAVESICDRESDSQTPLINSDGRRVFEKTPVSLYPNPGNGQGLILDILAVSNQKGIVEIYDLQGKIIHRKSLVIKEGKFPYKISLTDLSSGVYIVRYRSREKNFSSLWQVR